MSILVTVGAHGGYDRLVHAVDAWARERGRRDVFAQIGASAEPPGFVPYACFLPPRAYRERVEAATLLVAHAGAGTILTALERGKAILVMPRRAALGECRDDQQIATARAFAERGAVAAAFHENELIAKLDRMDALRPAERIPGQAPPRLLEALRRFATTGETG